MDYGTGLPAYRSHRQAHKVNELWNTMPKVMEHFTFLRPIKTPQTLICGAFECGGRSRNRTGVGGFAIHYFLLKNHNLMDNAIPQALHILATERQAYEGFGFEVRN